MKPVRFRVKAERDLLEATGWYEEQREGLGGELQSEVAEMVRRIAANPAQFPISYRGLRRALLVRFPYGLFYRETQDKIIVVAVYHSHRDRGGLDDR